MKLSVKKKTELYNALSEEITEMRISHKGETMTYIEQFRLLKTDHDKWKWLIDNSNIDHGLTVMLDNDETFVVTADQKISGYYFDRYIGNGLGVATLLDAMNIPNQPI